MANLSFYILWQQKRLSHCFTLHNDISPPPSKKTFSTFFFQWAKWLLLTLNHQQSCHPNYSLTTPRESSVPYTEEGVSYWLRRYFKEHMAAMPTTWVYWFSNFVGLFSGLGVVRGGASFTAPVVKHSANESAAIFHPLFSDSAGIPISDGRMVLLNRHS